MNHWISPAHAINKKEGNELSHLGVRSDDKTIPEPDGHLYPIDSRFWTPLCTIERTYLAAVLKNNIQSGRVERVMSRMGASAQAFSQFENKQVAFSPDLTWEELWIAYQHRMLVIFLADHLRIMALHSGNDLEWEALSRQLVCKAQHLLTDAGYGMMSASDTAAELAQQTCECMVANVYPCDIPLDYWLYTILKNVTLHLLTRSQDLLDRAPCMHSLDDLEDRGVPVVARSLVCDAANASVDDPSYRSGQIDALIDAIGRLQSKQRRTVVTYSYFADMTDDEIAVKMKKSKAVVHILRHRALKQLRVLVED